MPDFVIDCAQDWAPTVGVSRQKADVSTMEPYAGISGVTMTLSVTRGNATGVHAALQDRATAELTGEPGTIRATPPIDVDDLQLHLLPTHRNAVLYLNLFKAGEIFGEPLTCVVRADRLGV